MSEECDYRCKIVLVGESGVGKTCIINRFVDNVFDPSVKTTIASSFSTRCEKYNDKLIEMNVWDTIGQEKYRSFTNLFFKNANIVILVYDITNKKSFEEIKNYWYKEAKSRTSPNINKFIFI